MRRVPGRLLLLLGHAVSSATFASQRPDLLHPALRAAVHLHGDRASCASWRHRRGLVIGLVVRDGRPRRCRSRTNRIDAEPPASARRRSPWQRRTDAVHGQVAGVPAAGRACYLMFLNPFSANRPRWTGAPLRHGPRSGELRPDATEHGRGRTPYIQRTSVPTNRRGAERPPEDAAHHPREARSSCDRGGDGARTRDQPDLGAGRGADPRRAGATGVAARRHRLVKGTSYDVEWTVAAPGASAVPDAVDAAHAAGDLTVTSGYGDTVGAASKPTAPSGHPVPDRRRGGRLLLPSQPAIPGRSERQAGVDRAGPLPQLEVQARRTDDRGHEGNGGSGRRLRRRGTLARVSLDTKPVLLTRSDHQ